ncbi:hypothetical protein O181_103578 [Austropuccinia psidii MF-1]|uniref:Uncharacterized protein n=1 Tax=Austropuccinia psidii MF-1 TaxID=1389203 RepID=A0A9Q3JKL6_9BASI|nr:hypothetical protein [Austropuccinia psidii MF-1]
MILSVPKQKCFWKLPPKGDVDIIFALYKVYSYCIIKLKDSKVYNSRHIVYFEREFPLLAENQESNQTLIHFSLDEASEEYFDFHIFTHGEEAQYVQESCEEENNEEIEDHTSSESEEQKNPDSDPPPTEKILKVKGNNIIPDCQRSRAYLTKSDCLAYNKAIQETTRDPWKGAIKQELQTMKKLNLLSKVPIEKNIS